MANPEGAEADVEPAQPAPRRVFVDYKEERQGHSKDQKHKSVLFYLVDNHGERVLAVVGEDLGDAHYRYKTVETFENHHHTGSVDVRTRREVQSWLEMIIKESKLAAQGKLQEEMEHLGEQTANNPSGLYYTRHEQKRDHLKDDRRVNRWYLVDQYESLHLAVEGVERDARDGHYIYSACDPFSTDVPMGPCTNQQQVMHYLENFLTHHAKAGMHIGDHIRSAPHSQAGYGRVPHSRRSPKPKGSPDKPLSRGSTPPSGHSTRSKRGRPPSENREPPTKRLASPSNAPSPISHSTPAPALAAQKTSLAPATAAVGAPPGAAVTGSATPRTKLGGAAEASQARRAKAVQAAARAQVAALERAVTNDVVRQLERAQKVLEGPKIAALQWATQPTPKADVVHLDAYLPVIVAQLQAEGISVNAPAFVLEAAAAMEPPPHPEAAKLELLEAIREVSKVYASAELLNTRRVLDIFKGCEKHPCPAVQSMARDALVQWRRLAYVHLKTLADPLMALNPVAVFKEALEKGEIKIEPPEHLQAALQGVLPSPKHTALTPAETVQKLPGQTPSVTPPLPTASPGKAKEESAVQSISFGGAIAATGKGPPGKTPVVGQGVTLLGTTGLHTDHSATNVPCLPQAEVTDEQLTPQLGMPIPHGSRADGAGAPQQVPAVSADEAAQGGGNNATDDALEAQQLAAMKGRAAMEGAAGLGVELEPGGEPGSGDRSTGATNAAALPGGGVGAAEVAAEGADPDSGPQVEPGAGPGGDGGAGIDPAVGDADAAAAGAVTGTSLQGKDNGTSAGGDTVGTAGSKRAPVSSVAQWGTEEDAAAVIAAMPVPAQPTAAEALMFVKQVMGRLQRLPLRAVPELCKRAQQAVLQAQKAQTQPAKSQEAPAREQINASAQALVQMAEGLHPNLSPSEQAEVVSLLERHFKDLEISLDILHLGNNGSS